MTLLSENLFTILPELFVLVMSCLTLLVALFCSKKSQVAYGLTQFTLLFTICLVLYVFKHTGAGGVTFAFGHQFVLDVMSVVLKCFVCLIVFFTIVYARPYNDVRGIQRTEYYVLALLSTLGMMILISGHSLLTIYLGLELYSLPTFALVAMQRGVFRSAEAGMKYFIISALASGILLYGFSFLFGLTQQLDIAKIAHMLTDPVLLQYKPLILLSLVLIVTGVAFKLGAAPFQMWIPDVYEGAPTSTTLFIAAAPKIAAFAMVVRLLVFMLPSVQVDWQLLLIVISILSMTIGNFAAIMQKSVKRMLAYSSIAHIGYMLLGFVAGSEMGYAAALFYIISYAMMTVAGFGVLLVLSQKGVDVETLDDLSGLSQRNPWTAFLMLLTVFSMAGLPPLLGFIAKVHIFEALVAAHYVWLVVVALLLSVVGVYYYLRVIQHMYFKEPVDATPMPLTTDGSVMISINGLAILFMGIFPNWLFVLASDSFKLLA